MSSPAPSTTPSDSEVRELELELELKERELELLRLKQQLAHAKQSSEPAAATAPPAESKAPAQEVKKAKVSEKAKQQTPTKVKTAPAVVAPETPQPKVEPKTTRTTEGKVATTKTTPTRTKTPATTPAEPKPEEQAGNTKPWRWAAFLSLLPGWLISCIIHSAAVIVLAVIALPGITREVEQVLIASTTEEPVEDLIQPIVDLEVIPQEVDISEAPVAEIDPGASAMAEAILAEMPTELAPSFEMSNDHGNLFGEDGIGMSEVGQGSGSTSFFGVQSSGRVFVFVIDSSKSMNAGKFEAACAELIRSVRMLKPEQLFYVVFFDHDALRMFSKEEPELAAVPATPQNIYKLEAWVRTVELELKTLPYDSVEIALNLRPDAIYILTDGEFTDRGQTVKYLKDNNQENPSFDIKKTPIHTIAFYSEDGKETLTRIAEESGGTYRFVPKPGKKK
jgi:hypothetical protein